jgi:hypothetical protein
MKRNICCVISLALFGTAIAGAQSSPVRKTVSLDGVWQFQTDPSRVGEAAGWSDGSHAFSKSLRVPGVWQAQGVGEPRSFLRNDYVGLGWYRRDLVIPADWRGKAITMRFGGASRLTKVFVNRHLAGAHDGFSTPFQFDVTDFVRPGVTNHFVIAVDTDWPRSKPVVVNGRDISKPVGFLVYAANWGGLYGSVELVAHSDPYIEDAWVLPEITPGVAHVHVRVRSRKAAGAFRISAAISSADGRLPEVTKQLAVSAAGESEAVLDVPIPTAHLWTPEDPYLYHVAVGLAGSGVTDEVSRQFGMREFGMQGERLLLNGKPYFLRGYGDLDIEPFTGVPPLTVDEFVKRLRVAKQYGFNYARLHSRMPPPEMLQAADQVGLVISYELPVVYAEFLLPHSEFAGRELTAMVKETRGHPSVFSLDMGNEMDPDRDFTDETRPQMRALLQRFYDQAKALDPSLIVFGSDGFDIPPSDIASPMRGIVPGKVNLGHEFGGYPCSLPNPGLISQFTGLMVPYWLNDAQQWVKKNGLADVYPDMVRDSERLQWESHKFKIERLRATGRFSGYQLWAITDAPSGIEGGPWEEGVLDYFWRPKSVGADAYREFQSSAVLLIDREPQERTFWLDRGVEAKVSLSHFGSPLRKGVLRWLAVDAAGGATLNSGTVSNISAEAGSLVQLAAISFGKTNGATPLRVQLRVELEGEGLRTQNEWEFWGYPKQRAGATSGETVSLLRSREVTELYPWMKTRWTEQPPALVISPAVTPQVYDYVLAGGKAIVLLDKSNVDVPRDVNYFPDFVRWSPKAWGTRIEPGPFPSRFTQDGHIDMQFYDLMQDSYGLSEQWLAGAESGRMHPIMWGIRTIPGNLEKLGFVYEFRAGKGSVLLVTLNVERNLDPEHPAALFFFDQALRYVMSNAFVPKDVLTPGQFSQLSFLAYR